MSATATAAAVGKAALAAPDAGAGLVKLALAVGYVPTPVVLVGAVTMPWWHGPLSQWSDVAGLLGPILAVAVAMAKIYLIIRDGKDEKKEKIVESAVDGVKAVASTSRRWQFAGAAVVAIVAAMAAAAHYFRRPRANVMPTPPPIEIKPPVKARRRRGDDMAHDAAHAPQMAAGRGAGDDAGGVDISAPVIPSDGAPEWLALARAEVGTVEIKGPKHNPAIVGYFAESGHPTVKNDETAWCAAFVGAMLQRAGHTGTLSLAARSYEQFGEACEPKPGAVVVMWRGSKTSWQGHVGFYEGRGAKPGTIRVLGGNQKDGVSYQDFPESRVLGYRWPRPLTKSRTVRAQVAQIASITTGTGAGIAGALVDGQAKEAVGILHQIGAHWRPALFAALCISLAIAVYTMWVRADDARRRGR